MEYDGAPISDMNLELQFLLHICMSKEANI
jgi:hypothetical protein